MSEPKPSLLNRIRRGAGYLPGYGDHPGTAYVVGMTLIGGAAGANNGWLGFIVGAGVMAAVMVPLWLVGCVGRADDYDRRQRPTPKGEPPCQ